MKFYCSKCWRKPCECKRQEPVCDHIPMKAALDNSMGCIRCGKWLTAQ